ncbi:hypothetical protein C8J56DRAFT_790174, partial [Mycena floridula]
MTAKDEPSCPVLTGATNHQIWKLRIRNKLRRAEVWQIVIGSLPNPAIPVTVTDTNGNTTTTMPTITWSKDSWDTLDSKAQGIIGDYVSDAI